jgi:hypothetical protein
MAAAVVVTGVGMVPFAKPGGSSTYDQMGTAAGRLALRDAGIGYELVQQAYAGYVYGDSTAGQKAIYPLGLTGIPIVNVNNNCSTGSTALFLARQAVESGAVDCALVLGFEQMRPGALGTIFQDRPSPFVDFDAVTDKLVASKEIPLALRYFGGAGLSHMIVQGMGTLPRQRELRCFRFDQDPPDAADRSQPGDHRRRRSRYQSRRAAAAVIDLRKDDPPRARRHPGGSSRRRLSVLHAGIELHQRSSRGLRWRTFDMI